jgi:hypothetical protein
MKKQAISVLFGIFIDIVECVLKLRDLINEVNLFAPR